jgi:phosphate transport system substrate-binding protein
MKPIVSLVGLLFLAACLNSDRTIKIKGSDTEVNLSVRLAEAFGKQENKIFVSVSGGGSGLGIASLLNGNTHIANSSRKIKEEELQQFRAKQIDLDSFIFAQDAIAFVVDEQHPIDSMNTSHLAKILSGEEKSWYFLTGEERPITIYGRQSNSGTYEFIKNKLNISFSPYAKQMNGNAQILEALKEDNSGIGYVGAGYILDNNSKGLKILRIYSGHEESVSPLDAGKIREGKYAFQRPLYQYYKKSTYKHIKPFLDFENSAIGRRIIQTSGYYTIANEDE